MGKNLDVSATRQFSVTIVAIVMGAIVSCSVTFCSNHNALKVAEFTNAALLASIDKSELSTRNRETVSRRNELVSDLVPLLELGTTIFGKDVQENSVSKVLSDSSLFFLRYERRRTEIQIKCGELQIIGSEGQLSIIKEILEALDKFSEFILEVREKSRKTGVGFNADGCFFANFLHFQATLGDLSRSLVDVSRKDYDDFLRNSQTP